MTNIQFLSPHSPSLTQLNGIATVSHSNFLRSLRACSDRSVSSLPSLCFFPTQSCFWPRPRCYQSYSLARTILPCLCVSPFKYTPSPLLQQPLLLQLHYLALNIVLPCLFALFALIPILLCLFVVS